jgi:hypothetical protein
MFGAVMFFLNRDADHLLQYHAVLFSVAKSSMAAQHEDNVNKLSMTCEKLSKQSWPQLEA